MGFEDLELLKIIIVFGPNSDGIIVAATDEGIVVNPLDTFNIVSMALKYVFALVLVSRRVESPDPDVFVPTARGDLFVSLVPVDAFHLFII